MHYATRRACEIVRICQGERQATEEGRRRIKVESWGKKIMHKYEEASFYPFTTFLPLSLSIASSPSFHSFSIFVGNQITAISLHLNIHFHLSIKKRRTKDTSHS